MSGLKKEKQSLTRRDALKALAATGGAVALSTLPDKWETPVVEVGTLPAFAQGSPQPLFGFEPQVEITVDNRAAQFSEDPNFPGWLRVNTQGGAPLEGQATWDPDKPVRDKDKKWPNPAGVKVKIIFCFILKIIRPGPYPPPKKLPFPLPGTKLRLFGWQASGDKGHIDGEVGKVIDLKVCIIFEFNVSKGVPYFYFTLSFLEDIITLIDGGKFDVTNYVSTGIFKSVSKA